MIESLKRTFSLLPKKDHFKFFVIFLMMIFASFVEVIGIGMIPAFVVMIAEPDKVLSLQVVGPILGQLGITSSQSLALFGAVILIALYMFKNVYLTFYKYIKMKFVYNRKVYLQNRLFKAYMTAPYTFFMNRNSAELLRNVTSEVSKMITGTVMPFLEISLKVIMFILIISGLVYLEPLITLITILMMGGTGYLFLKLTQERTRESGRISRVALGDINRVILQALGGFKDARVLNREKSFLSQYDKHARIHVKTGIYQSIVKELPKPIIESLMVTGILTITLIMVYEGRAFSEIIPILTLFGVAAVKLMPVFNSVIQQVTKIGYSEDSVNVIFDDLYTLENEYVGFRNKILADTEKLKLQNSIELKNISFKYPNSDEYAVKNINLTIKNGSVVGFVGASGAGKTTLVDIILGLLEPEDGIITVDGVDIRDNIRGWMKNIGYIQQSNYLMDQKIFRNIAFGVPKKEIDEEKLNAAIKAAQLEETIARLPRGLKTRTGERGTRLSGGQQQRIGIARALYNNPQVLIMDEATSALDNITEKYVIEAIERLRGDRTIIMIAHRLTTVQNCDRIYLLDDGEIIDSGTYEELLVKSPKFREMSLVDDLDD